MSKSNVEAIYPLSPTQQGILFHTLYSPAAGIYIVQLSCAIHGDLDAAAFERAWQQVIERHPILRTAFSWERRETPLQVVLQRVRLPLEQLDWRDVAPDEQRERLEA